MGRCTWVVLAVLLVAVLSAVPPSSASAEAGAGVVDLPSLTEQARTRFVHGVIVVRPHGNWYHGYGGFTTDYESYRWLAFTAISMPLLDRLSEEQQRAHEEAQIAASEAPLGKAVEWRTGNARGEVVALREGTTTSGRRCREFRQVLSVGEDRQDAYGTGCLLEDGVWEVITTSTNRSKALRSGP